MPPDAARHQRYALAPPLSPLFPFVGTWSVPALVA